MVDINKNKIRIETYREFEDNFTSTSDKLTPEELKELIGSQVIDKVQEILSSTGEQHIHIESASFKVKCKEDYSTDKNNFNIKVHSEFIYLQLESDINYKDRMFILKREEAQLKELATKFGYKLKKN